MERVKGIEPSYSAWEAAALPLSYTRIALKSRDFLTGHKCGLQFGLHRPSKPVTDCHNQLVRVNIRSTNSSDLIRGPSHYVRNLLIAQTLFEQFGAEGAPQVVDVFCPLHLVILNMEDLRMVAHIRERMEKCIRRPRGPSTVCENIVDAAGPRPAS